MRSQLTLVKCVILCLAAAACGHSPALQGAEQEPGTAPGPSRESTSVEAKAREEATAADGTSKQESRVRVDGLYYVTVSANPDDPTYLYFRFYPDSTGITAHSGGEPEAVAKWLSKDHQYAQEGTYKLQGDTLTFLVGDERAGTTYSGTLTADGWILNPDGPNASTLSFARVDFPAAKPPGANHPPKIAPAFSKTDEFDYDTAGRVVGVTTTIEVKASDLDSDQLTYSWTASVGTITGDGPKGTWKRPLDAGQPSSGVVSVVVADSKGATVSRDFVFR